MNQTMRYSELPPPARLGPFLECLWTLSGGDLRGPAHGERILPDGCVELVLNFGDAFRRLHEDGSSELQPRAMLVGQMERWIHIASTGRVDLVGIRFRPAGAASVFPMPAKELAGRTFSLELLAGDFDKELARTFEVRGLSRRIQVIESALLKRLSRAEPDRIAQAGANAILRANGVISVSNLAEGLGIDGKQLERRFDQWVGLTPKTLCRILRFQKVFQTMGRGPRFHRGGANWAEVAVACGYYDQAHLIRDFRAFAGEPPASLLRHPHELMLHFTRKNRMSDSYKTAS